MSFAFLHPEFFAWMLPPVLALFYLWMTQKTSEQAVFSPKALERLRAPAVSMGLQGRNGLFLAASMLLIAAMAQPVAFDEASLSAPRANVLLAMDISYRSPEDFERSKGTLLSLISALEGENIGVVAYDEFPYRIAPLSRDTAGIAGLVSKLSPDVIRFDSSNIHPLIESLSRSNRTDDPLILIPIGSKSPISRENHGEISVVPLHTGESADSVRRAIRSEQTRSRQIAHIPLFHYPLGLAMLLIGFALSSMSKRRSVPLIAVLLAIALPHSQSNAGILDFQILNGAKAAYEEGEYARSAELFERYQQHHDTPQIRYNRANALYKAQKYAQARFWYERVYTTDPVLREWTRYNLERTLQKLNQDGSQEKPDAVGEKMPQDRLKRGGRKKTADENTTRLYRIF